jgi:hypothetical protein
VFGSNQHLAISTSFRRKPETIVKLRGYDMNWIEFAEIENMTAEEIVEFLRKAEQEEAALVKCIEENMAGLSSDFEETVYAQTADMAGVGRTETAMHWPRPKPLYVEM